MIKLSRLKELLHYSPETGEFTRLEIGVKGELGTLGNARYIGQVAGWLTAKGYRVLSVAGKNYCAHRLAWFYMTGQWPINQIDHINLDKADNRWVNLRQATNSQNQQNCGIRKDNSSGYKGVTYLKRKNPWRAHIGFQGKQIYLGSFATPEEANQVRIRMVKKYHGEFARLTEEFVP